MTGWHAEIGSNHCGSLDRAIALIRKAADIGCEGVKFQYFRTEKLYAPEVLASDQALRERKAWELPDAWLEPLSAEAVRRGVLFGITVFGRDPEDYERASLYADYLKVSSYQVTDLEQLSLAADQDLPLIISFGMATKAEVDATAVVTFGRRRVTLLHCVSSYPAPMHEANLRSIQWLRERNPECTVGWSDHTHSEHVLLRAAHFYRADHIEFHLDLDGDGWEYWGGHCWLPDEIEKVISHEPLYDDEGVYACDGKKTKAPSVSEDAERSWRSDPTDGLRPMLSQRELIASK